MLKPSTLLGFFLTDKLPNSQTPPQAGMTSALAVARLRRDKVCGEFNLSRLRYFIMAR